MSGNHASANESESAHRPLLRPHWRWRLLGICAALTIILGTKGFLDYGKDSNEGRKESYTSVTNAEAAQAPMAGGKQEKVGQKEAPEFGTALYHAIQLVAMHSPHFEHKVSWTLEIARWLGAISVALAVMEFVRHAWSEELTTNRLKKLNGHVVVCGLGRKGFEVVRYLRSNNRDVVVIEKAPEPGMIDTCHSLGAFVLKGDATNPDILREARVECSTSVIAICPDESTNCETAVQVCRIRQEPNAAGGSLMCQVHLSDSDLRAKLQATLGDRSSAGRVRLRFFDAFDPEARQVLVHDLPLDHTGVGEKESRQVHLVIVGFGRMGRALAVRAAQLGTFANGKKLKISVIDRKAHARHSELQFHHPRLDDVCEMEFHELEAVSAEARQLLEQWCGERDYIVSAAVCFDNERRGLEIAVQLLPLLGANDAHLAVRMSRESGLAHLISESGIHSELKDTLRPFGMEERCCHAENLGENINEKFARDIHAAYVRMRQEEDEKKPGSKASASSDVALRDWSELTEDLRESNRQQADHIFIKLRAIGCDAVKLGDPRPAVTEFTKPEVELLEQMEHRRWMAERLIANWTYAPNKNVERRENPNLVEWDKLPENIKDYDREVVRAIPSLLGHVGMKAVRREVAGVEKKAT